MVTLSVSYDGFWENQRKTSGKKSFVREIPFNWADERAKKKKTSIR